jgi:tripartite-type tricarboxylate transporter receptor subunit TctC
MMSRIAQSSKAVVLIASLGAVIAAPTAGRAQSTDYPSQRISFIVGFAVGGFADTIARWVAIRLGERTGQTVVVQNMEGGGGVRAEPEIARRIETAGLQTTIRTRAERRRCSVWKLRTGRKW